MSIYYVNSLRDGVVMGQYTIWEIILILILVAVIFGANPFLRLIGNPNKAVRGKDDQADQSGEG
ncbi:MAG: hypothetical protein LBP92_13375 [Deltaproteobacteria bacterium]|jgi:Sec-independent protein translocase protein TatA|nr:hypothetical protein [Deltaproteobacteria bacterium]